jgi:hypothetical protein
VSNKRATGFFETATGTPHDPHHEVQQQPHPILDSSQLLRFSWHLLRKLPATSIANLRVERRIPAAALEHAGVAVTVNVYTQVLPELHHRTIVSLERFLFRNVLKLETLHPTL